MFYRIFPCACLAMVWLAGCGDSGPRCVPVGGTATLDGKPLANKSVMFVPESGTAGNGATAHTDQAGKYSLTAIVFGATRNYPGVPAGRYRVTVNEAATLAGQTAAVGVETDEVPPAMVLDSAERKSDIPAAYTSEKTTPLVFDVPESGDTIDLELVSNPPARGR
ncbi:MAG: hypothetical protein U1E05_09720 [Patescibacteria group bacterium]|nr:hypothetical protein [Patescibacteria group bacterium]